MSSSSSTTLPISPTRFATALKDLTPTTLLLKTLEIRNSIAHLLHSNEQLRAFPADPDCVDAVRENETVLARMHERLDLIRAEVRARGISSAEFDDGEGAGAGAGATTNGGPLTNGPSAAVVGDGSEEESSSSAGRNPWTDGTFQTGVIRNGEIHMDAAGQTFGGARSSAQGSTFTVPARGGGPPGGSLTDDELRRRLEHQLAEDDDGGDVGDEQEGGLHL